MEPVRERSLGCNYDDIVRGTWMEPRLEILFSVHSVVAEQVTPETPTGIWEDLTWNR